MAARLSETTSVIRCSFCGTPNTEVRKVVAGPGVYICDECVHACTNILDEEGSAPAEPRIPVWATLTDEQMLDHILRIAGGAAQVEDSLRAWVTQLRERGVTWARIGAALGMTRQSAWERFSSEE